METEEESDNDWAEMTEKLEWNLVETLDKFGDKLGTIKVVT